MLAKLSALQILFEHGQVVPEYFLVPFVMA